MIAINGDAKPDIIIGPMNDRGTTPGNSWWSYYHRTRICYKRLVTCLSFFFNESMNMFLYKCCKLFDFLFGYVFGYKLS